MIGVTINVIIKITIYIFYIFKYINLIFKYVLLSWLHKMEITKLIINIDFINPIIIYTINNISKLIQQVELLLTVTRFIIISCHIYKKEKNV